MLQKIKDSRLLLIALLFALAGLILAGLLSCKDAGLCKSSLGCSIDGVDGCSELAGSQYSKILGLPIAYLGFLYYAFVAFLLAKLCFVGRRQAADISLLMAVAAFGFAFDLFLAYRNFFQLPIPCLLCAYTYICQAGIFVSLLALYLRQKGDASSELASLSQGGLRSWPAMAGALVLTGLFYIIMNSSSPKAAPSRQQADPYPLLKMSRVSEVLRDLRALKRVEIDEQGLEARKSYEGSPGAYVKLHEWIDFRCPHCYNAGQVVKRAMNRWPGRIQVYHRHFPLDGTCNPLLQRRHPDAASCRGAFAAICAARQGNFSRFYHGLFEFQRQRIAISLDSIKALARQVGSKEKQLLACMGSKAAATILQSDIDEAAKIGLKSTPTLVLNGHLLPAGTPQEEWFFRMLDALVLEQEGEDAIEDYEARSHIRSYSSQ